jgi:hypothetical protein
MGVRYKSRCTGTLKEKLENRLEKQSSGCWLWTGYVNKGNGYGVLSHEGKPETVHRLSYQCYVGDIPPGMFVLHKCDVRACFNPDHLMVGTHLDNMADMRAKRRYPLGDQHYNTKVSDASVEEIKTRKRAGERADKLAAEYGVSKYTIWGIVSGKWRKELPAIKRLAAEL